MRSIIENHTPEFIDFDSNRKSAVLIPLIKKDERYYILFEVRAAGISQPGDISFPGGVVEKGESIKETVIRETKEELGLKDTNISFWGQCDTYWNGKNRIIYSFAGQIDPEAVRINHDEVESIFTVPLEYFLENDPMVYETSVTEIPNENFPYEKIQGGRKYRWIQAKKQVLFYEYDGYVIWGITAKLLHAFIKVIRNETKDI